MIAEFSSGDEVPLVVLASQGVTWALEARMVLHARLASEWTGAPPIDVGALWGGLRNVSADSARVVVVATKSGARAFSSVHLSFRSVEREKIVPLPLIVARGRGGRFFRGVVFSESGPATLVLEPDAFVDEPRLASNPSPG